MCLDLFVVELNDGWWHCNSSIKNDDEDDEAIAERDQHRQRYLKRRYDFFFTAQGLSIIVRDKPVKFIIVENIMAVLVLFLNKNINESRRRWRPQVPTNN
jgi:hypothetical protein